MRLSDETAEEWGGSFAGQHVGRARGVTHRLAGRAVTTKVELTSPLRSVGNPLSFIVRSQPSASMLFHFRLDDAAVGLDMNYYLA